ncbi:MAG TPA: hypothetical protein VFM17_10355 [Candidatus Eisenbacteria bacterium]|nr:hypothetical protein [Candidatus Eisenbacteria bacterium]
MTVVEFSGRRYVAAADLGLGVPVPLMVHGNASFYMTVTHEIGERVSGGPVTQLEEYGYSARGRGRIEVPTIRVGGRDFPARRDVPVFDFTEERGGPVQGMLGVPFLVEARAVVDFARDVLILGVAPAETPDSALLAEGYRHAPIRLEAGGKTTIDVSFPALGRAIPVTPSTVSSALSLHRPFFEGRVPLRAGPAPADQSPHGTRPGVATADSIEYVIAGTRFLGPATLEDWAEYAGVPEDELKSFGMLGFDWMKEHAANLDYANLRLYFKP